MLNNRQQASTSAITLDNRRREAKFRLDMHKPALLLTTLVLVFCAQIANADQSIPLVSHPAAFCASQQLLDCSDYCSNANDCVGVQYTNGQCTILGNAQQQFSNDAQAHLITKSCVKSERICASPFHFDVHEQKILVGFAREVVPADSIQVCLSACLNAFDTFGFECESVMFYPVDSECILNTEDRLDRPDLFVDEHEDQVIYLDNNCAGSQCYAPYVTQYVAVEGKQLKEEMDHQFTDLDWASCEELCTQRLTTTVNDFNCKSFMYDNQTRTCILSDERSRPLGRGNLTEATGFTYYEKKCFASPRTCRNVPSFTRVPQMLLVGFAAFVMENVPSVTMCLDQCTNPPPETGDKFVCKSAMYYYNEQECILNAESRHTKPDLFIPEEDDFVVDYFDINCRLEAEKCPEGKQLHTVKTLNAKLPEGDGSLHVIESAGISVSQCMIKCFSLAPEKCRSFNFDKAAKMCNMLYLDGKTTLRPQVKQGVDLYDLHCLQGPAASVQCLNKDDALFSRYLYTQQAGLPSKELTVVSLSKCLDTCSNAQPCQGVNYNRRNGNCALFEKLEAGEGVKHDHIDFYKNLCQVKEVDTGLSSAVNVPKEQIFVKSETSTNITDLINKKTSKTATKDDRAQVLIPEKKAGSNIHPVEVRRKNEGPDAAVDANSVTGQGQSSAKASLSVGNTGNGNIAAPLLIPASAVHTICNYEGIKVQIKNEEPFSGVVFVKNKYDTCRVEVGGSDSATLVLGLPANFGMKPILLNGAKPATAKAEIETLLEVPRSEEEPKKEGLLKEKNSQPTRSAEEDRQKETTNNLGIPGLVTSMDQIYEISCNYSSMLGGR
uniref:Apple domain-containing protein n=1 Tax=Ditylenchus dipsaci TaxID=166011 RepID=A0A915CUF9_9BILA